MNMTTTQFPEWAKIIYRGVRAGFSAGVASILVLKLDLSNPQEALKIVAITFGTAFAVAFGKWLRDWLDEVFGFGEKSLVAKTMPF